MTPMTRPVAYVKASNLKQQVSPAVTSPGSGIYKYRDPDKWRAYMRGYMAKRREKTT
jgi:hypothetical protein